MESKHLPLLSQDNHQLANSLAYQLARQQLSVVYDIEEHCRKSGAECRATGSQKSISVQYLNLTYQITLPDVEISLIGNPGEITVRDKILILHYLLNAKGTPLTNKLITFRELAEGNVYYPTFAKRTIQPLVDNFGLDLQLLLEVGLKLGAQKADHGDIAVALNAFPHVPVTIVLWRGDDEFPARGNVLFDANISDNMPTEDVTVLCETIAWRLAALKRSA